MFITAPKQQNILRVPDNFLTLVKVDTSGSLSFEVLYNIKQSDVIKQNATKTRITVSTKQVKQRNPVYDNTWPKVNNVAIARNIQLLSANVRASVMNQENFQVAQLIVDNTQIVNNEFINQLRSDAPLGAIQGMMKPYLTVSTVHELNKDNINHPILQLNPAPPIEDIFLPPTQHVFEKNLVKKAIDPTHVYDLENEGINPQSAIQGVYNINANRHVNNVSSQLQDLVQVFKQITFVPQAPDTLSSTAHPEHAKILTFSTRLQDNRDIFSQIVLPAAKVQDTNGNWQDVYFQFDVLDGTSGVTIQTIQKKVSVLQHIEIFYTPKSPPIALLSKFDRTNSGNIKVRQQDPNAVAIRLYRKDLAFASNTVGDYNLVNEFPLRAESKFQNIDVDVSAGHTTIYRLISVGQHEILGSDFTNVVVKPSTPVKKITFVSVVTQIVAQGINVEIRDIPSDVVAIRVVRRDETIHEKNFSIVGDDNVLINPQDPDHLYVVVDNSVFTGHVYSYCCDMIFRDGTITRSGNAIVEFQPLVENLVDTQISNLNVTFDINALNVEFDVATTVIETQLDTVKNMLLNQGLHEHFVNDITAEREKLASLIAHQIHRIDLTLGQRENFGTVTSTHFSDAKLRNVNSVSPLQDGHTYRYEVVACLRATETLLENYVKQAVDDATKKPYIFSPNKFFHPITLNRGSVANPGTISLHYSKDQMAFGSVGNLSQVDVSFGDDTTKIIDASVESFDLTKLLIKWDVEGDVNNVDHFIIMREHLGQRKIVGKSHADFGRTAFTYVYTLDPSFDKGELFFVVQPLYNDYAIGSTVKTNGITLE